MHRYKFVLYRPIQFLPVLFGISVVTFVLVRLIPGDPARVLLGARATPTAIANIRRQYGLDEPMWLQYFYFVKNLLNGEMGKSILYKIDVLKLIMTRIEPTLVLVVTSVALSVLIAVPMAALAARNHGRFADHAVRVISTAGIGFPPFWLGLMLIQVFAVGTGWFPASGYGGPDTPFLERLHHLVLPAVALGVVNSALITRFTRAAMLDVLGEDYVRTARAKGANERRVILKHALKNALIPIITVIGLSVAMLVAGAVVTETVFGLPGVGNLVVSAVLRRDYPVIQGTLLVVAAIYVLINFIVDMLYILVDPRVRL